MHLLLLLLLLLLLPGVHLVLVVRLILQVFLLPGALPLFLLLRVLLLGLVPLPVDRELLPITHPLPITVVTATVTTAITLVHLDAVASMVALAALAGLVVVVLRGVLGELLHKKIWLRVSVLVWEMEVVASKVIPEVPREIMRPGMWILGGGGGSSSRVVTGAIGGTPAHHAVTGLSEAGVTTCTPRTPVQPTCGRGWSGLSGACRRSAGPDGTGWTAGGGRRPTRSGGGCGRAGAGAGGSATT